LRGVATEIHRLREGPLGRYFGGVMLRDLTPWKVRGYVKARREGKIGRPVGPAAINRDLARLKHLWNAAKRRKLVSGDNPVSESGKLKEPGGRVRYLTWDEEERLLAACPEWLRDLVIVACHTGIRRGALLGLQWQDVHFEIEEGMIRVSQDLSKNGEEYWVHMNPTVREALERVLRASAQTEASDYVFGKPNGQRRKSIRTAWKKALERAGIEDFRFHDLRHTAASRVVMRGGSLYDAGRLLGHRTPGMTQRYAHLSPEHMQGVARLTERPAQAIDPPSGSRLGHARKGLGSGGKS
jgi:integrase